MRCALFRKLTRFLERTARGRTVGLHSQLADEHHHPHLRIDLIDLARELQRVLRLLDGLVAVGLRHDLGLRRLDRGESRLALRVLG